MQAIVRTKTQPMELAQLQLSAKHKLISSHTVPQRYGTAFHISAPNVDVRKLPKHSYRHNHSMLERFSGLSIKDRQIMTTVDLQDVYLSWLLSCIDETLADIIVADSGEIVHSQIDRPGLVLVLAKQNSKIILESELQQNEMAISRTLIWQKSESSVKFTGLRASNNFLNERVIVNLIGRGASCDINHVQIGSGASQADLSVQVNHKNSDTKTNIVVRIAGGNKSRNVYRGLIDVDETAPGTKGYQSAEGLLLSRQAVVDILPELAIRTDKVQCSHGVTTTHVDDRMLMYMRSRGLSKDQAKELAILGFMIKKLELSSKLTHSLQKLIKVFSYDI